MKKILCLVLAAAFLLTATACGSKKNAPGTIKDDKSLQEVLDAVDTKFKEKYGGEYGAIAMKMSIDNQYLSDFADLDASAYDEYAGAVSMSMTNSDALFAVKAKEGKVDVVQQALEKRLADLVAQYEFYNVNGSYDRAKSGEVYIKGNYVFLIVVGYMTGQELEAPDFSQDVQLTKETIDGMFNA
ncbi:MAG TPA: DUF4358 domain-containing protein [Clostridia bacterium]|nr:DUF4358 domain-containing protein [Clostridia bacterium]